MKYFAIVELLGGVALCALLLMAFWSANYPNVLYAAAIRLVQAGLVVLGYLAGRFVAGTYPEGARPYLALFYGVGVLTLIAWATAGSHQEGGDIFGGGQIIRDFIPTEKNRAHDAVIMFADLLLPGMLGVYRKKEDL